MASQPPPLPQWNTLPPPLPPAAMGAVPYYTPERAGEVCWVTIASLPTGQWHASCRLLTAQHIVTRLDASSSESNESGLQVPSTEAEWAREILSKGIPSLAGMAEPPGGFPVTLSAPAPAAYSTAAPVVPMAAMPVAHLAPGSSRGDSSGGALYYLGLSFAWIVVIVILLSVILMFVAPLFTS